MTLAATVTDLLESYGYGVVALGIGIESSGIPFPGETVLVVAATYAGHTHRLEIGWVIAAAVLGAVVGDNLGFAVGHFGGMRLLRRHGHRVHLDDRRIKLGVWLFRRYGVLVVFFGRFVALLRAWAALLAGTNKMPWHTFLLANAAGGIVWAAAIGLLAYRFGEAAAHVAGTAGWVLFGVAAIGVLAMGKLLKRYETRLLDEAERAVPESLDELT
jgi:membrane protein DedA with SNARE-associated domain